MTELFGVIIFRIFIQGEDHCVGNDEQSDEDSECPVCADAIEEEIEFVILSTLRSNKSSSLGFTDAFFEVLPLFLFLVV